MSRLYKEFVHETFDKNGNVERVTFKQDPYYNFGYDVVDRIAGHTPEKIAMVWCNDAGDEKYVTFGDMKENSDKTAAYFQSLGIGKGDAVMLILKRHYEWWYCMVALHKIGAIAIPVTNQLLTHDIVYRINAASIKAVVCTSDGEVSDLVDEAQKETADLKTGFITRRLLLSPPGMPGPGLRKSC